ncbi:MAG: peptidoglycan DD-metalloendopeptidase family protein [Myxococcales bacterium]|nr:peptidoglycan DD-metalloendopeptidase family protein [Myxococcales bacterium]
MHTRPPGRLALALALTGLTACAPSGAGGDPDPLDGAVDGGPLDGGPLDAGPLDAGGPDAATPDAAVGDAQPPEPDAEPLPEGPGWLAFPVHPDDRDAISSRLMFGVDHDGRDNGRTACEAYDGDPFPACYGGHDGSDFILNGGFRAMDAGSARVAAAAPGLVVRVEDGHYDRCRGSIESLDVDCDGHPMVANKVYVEHANGWRTHYLHLMRGSIVVREGQRVGCGDVLGLIGSSGYSTMPHLHLEVQDPAGRVVDPYHLDPTESLWRVPETATDIRPGACR